MELIYTRRDDFLIPNIVLNEPPPGTFPPLGGYALRRQRYLKEHCPILYAQLLLSEQLYPLLRETDEAAAHRLTVIADRYQAEGIINELVYE